VIDGGEGLKEWILNENVVTVLVSRVHGRWSRQWALVTNEK